MKILTVNPRLIVQKHDTLTTGIIYMPIGLAHLNGILKSLDIDVDCYDLFGHAPSRCEITQKTLKFGLKLNDFQLDFQEYEAVMIFANQAANHESILETIHFIRSSDSKIPIFIVENSQAVTAYSVSEAFKDNELDIFLVNGIMKQEKILNELKAKLNFKFSSKLVSKHENYDWELIPIKSYWNIKLGHGPITNDRYLPILTSFGCPFSCEFCVVPGMNFRKWSARQSIDVLNEMISNYKLYNVQEFHLEDLNPSIDIKRLVELAELIIDGNYPFIWKIVAGTKAETVKTQEIVRKLATGGLRYLSISPESGSSRVRKIIGKRFDTNHGLNLIKWCKESGVKTQACFVLGMPGEKHIDRLKSLFYSLRLTIGGLDEIAIFIITPIAGSRLHEDNNLLADKNNISFSPNWRPDYLQLQIWRLTIYFHFLLVKTIFHPISIFKNIKNFISRNYELKMEMAPRRSMYWKKMAKNK